MSKKTNVDYRKAALKALGAQLKSPDPEVVLLAAKTILSFGPITLGEDASRVR